ncbi:MAG: hypothetical protein O3A00_14325 [Planctomycetota bacterium]|nr:hypothetical protein [Planctomycetota bacterium]
MARMSRTWMTVVVATFALPYAALAQTPTVGTGPSPVARRVAAAQAAGKHTFLLLTDQLDQNTRDMANTLQQSLAKHPRNTEWIVLRVTDPAEKKLISQLSPESVPCVMVLAPNGVLTGIIPHKITAELIEESIVTPAFARCLLAMQQNKFAVLCVLGPQAQALPTGVSAFLADPNARRQSEVVAIRSDNPAETKLVHQLGMNRTSDCRVLVMSPSEQLLGTFDSAVTREELIRAVSGRVTVQK